MSDTGAQEVEPGAQGPVPTALETEIPLQPKILRRAAESFATSVRQVMDRIADGDIDDWVVTGCGDSLFAGVCAEVWFARLAGRRLRAVPAMQLARETYEALTPRSVVFAVSHSGTTARVLEAARAAHARGALVIAVTANQGSELGRSSDLCIDNTVREERSNCRTASFQAVLLLMRMIAEALAEAHGRSTRMVDLAAVEPYVVESRRQIDQLTDSELQGEHWIFTGSGLGFGAAEYGMAKVYEAATLPAHSVELEQFIHCEIFTVRKGTKVVIICPAGRASSRAVELAQGLAKLEAVTIAITDDPELADSATHVIDLPAGLAEDDLPFLAILPLQWLALRLALARNENPDLVSNKWVNRPLIDHSSQWGPEKYADAVGSSVRP